MSGEPKLRSIAALLVIAAGLAVLTWHLTKGGRTGERPALAKRSAQAPAGRTPLPPKGEAERPAPKGSAKASAVPSAPSGPAKPPEAAAPLVELVEPPAPDPGRPIPPEAAGEGAASDARRSSRATVRVSVVDETGAPLSGATVTLARREAGVPVEERVGETGVNGTIEFPRPSDPGAIVRASALLRLDASAPLGEGEARIELRPAIVIPVSIENRTAIPAIERIRLLAEDGTRAGRDGDWARAPDGAFVGCPGPGTYRIEVHAAGFAPATSGPIEVEAGRIPPRVALALEPIPGLRGRVATSAGDPLDGAEVEIRRSEADPERAIEVLGLLIPDRRGEIVARIRAGSDGTFQLDGLPPGTYRAWARARGFGESASPPFDLPGAAEIAIALSPGGAIRGSLRPGRTELAAAVRSDGLFRVAPVGSDGAFEIRDLPAGAYAVVPLPAASAGPPGGFPIEVRPGEVTSWSAAAPAGG